MINLAQNNLCAAANRVVQRGCGVQQDEAGSKSAERDDLPAVLDANFVKLPATGLDLGTRPISERTSRAEITPAHTGQQLHRGINTK